MPPAIILSPYSGRPVKIREQDLGRALRDEQGRVFYVVEDPEHGRYAARTRKGSPKDLQRYREIEAKTAQLDDEVQPTRDDMAKAHDAAGKKRKNKSGIALIVIVVLASVAIFYAYLNYPEWFGVQPKPATDSQPDDADASSQAPAALPVPQIVPASTAAASTPIVEQPTPTPTPTPQPEAVNADPEPVYVPTAKPEPQTPEQATRQPTKPVAHVSTPRTVPIAFTPPATPREARQSDFKDFRHTASGLRYKITHLTDGPSARAGNVLTVRYAASTLDGKPLINDASQTFILATGQAIRAFDEGLAGIREGEQLRLLIPRGHSDTGTLPGIERIPDAPFLLDVQLVSVRPGVSYIIEKHGDIDSRPAMPGDTVDLHYLARVEGQDDVIDATVHHGKPLRITLGNNEVIPGLELGVAGMREGESRQLTVPPYLAYGKYSVAGGLIPEDAVLSFRITLVQIVEDAE